jgi:hypothetical protein
MPIDPMRTVHRGLVPLVVAAYTTWALAQTPPSAPPHQATSAAQPASGLDPAIEGLLSHVSEDRLRELLTRLQGFGTRHTLSSQDDPARGIGAAAEWIAAEFRRSPRLQVSFDWYDLPAQGDRIVRDTRLRNVVAVLPGRSPRRIYVTAHYDSLARPPRPDGAGQGATVGFDWSAADHDQPGANDDGSGTVAVMEVARLLADSGLDFDATLVFATLAGEEQGLVGALLHAQRAQAEGWRIDAVFNNDLLGNAAGGNGVTDSGSVRVFSEGPEDSPSRQVARYVARVGARYLPAHRVRLLARHDRFGRGGDHTAFNQHGYAGVRIVESSEHFGRQHTVQDTVDGISWPYLVQNVRLNVAVVASAALAPPPPRTSDARGRPMLGRGQSGYDAALRWEPSPGAVGYRVFWREAWTPDWQHEAAVGTLTAFTLRGLSIDDVVIGVSAVGRDGHESVVSAYVNPPRSDAVMKTK